MRSGVRGVLTSLILGLAVASPCFFCGKVGAAQYLVAQDGTGTHATIQGAINAASYGDVIYVEPGVYSEGLTFKNGLTLIGAGTGSTVVRYGYGFDPVLVIEHVSAGRIEGMTVERTETTLAAPAVVLRSASITIANCVFRGGKGSGIEISDATSRPTLDGVRSTENDGDGLWAHGGSRPELVDCLLDRNAGHGILASDDADVALGNSTIEENLGHGIALVDRSTASIVGGAVRNHSGWGVALNGASAATLTGCRLSQNTGGGVRLHDTSGATMVGCTIEGGQAGAEAADEASLRVKASSVRSVLGTAIAFSDRSSGGIVRSDIAAAGGTGLQLTADGVCTVDRVTIVHCGGTGLLVRGPDVSVSDSIVAYNAGRGIDVDRSPGTSDDLAFSHNNVWANAGGDYVGITPRPSDLSEAPDFVDLDAGDLRLRPESPCIDRGNLGATIGAYDDPTRDPTGRLALHPKVRNLLPGIDVAGFVQCVVSPFELETAGLSVAYATEHTTFGLSSALLGTWGRRTLLEARIEASPIGFASAEAFARLDVRGVLDGTETHLALTGTAGLSGSGFSLSGHLARTWPSSRWTEEISCALGDRLRLELVGRAAGLVPEFVSIATAATIRLGQGALTGRAALEMGPDRLVRASLEGATAERSFSVSGSAYLASPGHAKVQARLSETAAGLDLRLALRLAAGAFEDGELELGAQIGATRWTASLGIDRLGRARGDLCLAATFGGSRAASPNLLPRPASSVAPDEPAAGTPVHFDASGSDDEDGELLEYWWDFGDGEAALGATVEHIFLESGTYTVTLTVADDDGATATLSSSLVVHDADRDPVADFFWEAVSEAGSTLDRPLRAGDAIRLDASDAYDPLGRTLSYAWDLESDGIFDLDSTDPIVVARPLEAGTHPITLRVVTDDGRSDAILRAVLVAEARPPRADFTFTPSTPSILDPVRFEDLSSDVDGEIVAWAWSFGDGMTSGAPGPIHQFSEAGSYLVALTVTDDDGLSARKEQTIVVASHPEVVTIDEVWVLAIGISDYESVTDLQFATQDAIGVANWATEAGVPIDHIRLLTDRAGSVDGIEGLEARRATLVNVRESLGWIRRSARRDDLVMISFSGHGYQGADDGTDERDGVDEFFVLADTLAGAVDDTALRDDEFGSFLDRVASQHVLVFFDGCYSGGLARSLPSGRRPIGEVPDLLFRDFSLEGRLVLSAASETQDAFESPALGHGVFTHFVLEGLRGAADRNGDGHVTAWEVYEYVLAEVPPFVRAERGVDQIPQILGEGDTRVLLARPPGGDTED